MKECQEYVEKKNVYKCKKLTDIAGKNIFVPSGYCKQCKGDTKEAIRLLKHELLMYIFTNNPLRDDELNKKILTYEDYKREILFSYFFVDYDFEKIKKVIKEKIDIIIKTFPEYSELFDKILDKNDKELYEEIYIEFEEWFKDLYKRLPDYEEYLKFRVERGFLSEDFFIRIIDSLDLNISNIDTSIKIGREIRQKLKEDPSYRPPLKPVSLKDKINGIKGAFKRIKERAFSEGEKTIWVSEKEAAERQVCCSVCTDGSTCPYCGCQIKKSWFLPLGKSELTTEGCPNSNTYPHLKNFPPKNYWKVCNQKSTILFFYKEDDIMKLNNILDKLIKNATGEIEIIVGVQSNIFIPISKMAKNIVFRTGDKNIEELKQAAKGDYIFLLEQCDYEDMGYDTKLKYKFL